MKFDGVEIKILGRNLRGKLPNAPDPRKIPRNGDGDEFIDLDLDGQDDDPIPAVARTAARAARSAADEVDVPKAPPVQDPVAESTWAERHAKRIERRRKMIDRVRKRPDRWGGETPENIRELEELTADGDFEPVEKEMRRLFEIEDLGGTGAKSVVMSVEPLGPVPDSEYPWWGTGPGALVNGVIVDADGEMIGEFSRDVDFENGVVHHASLVMDEGFEGQGIGSDFITDTEAQYHRLGIKAIDVEAGLKDGPYTWAVAGFDWSEEAERRKFLMYMRANIEQYLSGKRTDLFEDREEALELRRLVERAEQESFDDPDRLTPYAFTLYKGAREGLTKQSNSSADRRGWNGRKPVRPLLGDGTKNAPYSPAEWFQHLAGLHVKITPNSSI